MEQTAIPPRASGILEFTMRNSFRPVVIVFLIVAGLAAVTGLSSFLTPKEIIPWRSDFAAASAEAKAANKKLMVDFSATWCGPCQSMRHSTWSDGKVAEELRNYVPVQVDVDRQQALVERFGVRAFPTLIVMDDHGQVIRSEEGALDAEDFLAWLRS